MPTILVVDDARFGRNTVCRALAKEDYEVVQAENGRQALEQIKVTKPDLIFTDLLMPEMDGFELLRNLRAGGCQTPVCVVSADIQDSSRQIARDLGASSFINKPFKPEEILDVVHRALNTVKGV